MTDLSQTISSPLSERAMLVSLTIRMPSNSKQDKDATDEVASSHNSKEGLARVNKSLFDKEAVKGFRGPASDARQTVYDMSLPWTQKGVRILLAENYFKLMEKINTFEASFNAGQETFLSKYETLVEQSIQDLGTLGKWEDYPSREEMEAAFEFELKFMPLSEASDWRVKLGTEEEERIKETMMKQKMASLFRAQEDVWERIKVKIEALASRLEERLRQEEQGTEGRKTPIKSALIDNIVDLVELLPGLNLTNDPKINTIGEDLRKLVNDVTPEGLKASVPLQRKVAENARNLEKKVDQWAGLL